MNFPPDGAVMVCPICGGDMARGPVVIAGVYREFPVMVRMPDGFACPTCKFTALHGRDNAEFVRRLRQRHRRLFLVRLIVHPFNAFAINLVALASNVYALVDDLGAGHVRTWTHVTVILILANLATLRFIWPAVRRRLAPPPS